MKNNNLQINELTKEINSLVNESRNNLMSTIMLPVEHAVDTHNKKYINLYKKDGRLAIFNAHNADLSDINNNDLMPFFDKYKGYVIAVLIINYLFDQIDMHPSELKEQVDEINDRYDYYKSLQDQLIVLESNQKIK